MQKIKPRPNPHKPGEMERADRITVTLKNGSVHTIEVAERTTLTSQSDIHAKFMSCATLALSPTRAEQLGELVDRLESVADIIALIKCMNGPEIKSA